MLDKGSFGNLFSFQLDCFWNRQPAYYQNTWKGTYSLDGGTLFTQFSHYIDVLCWYFGEAKSVSGIRKNFCHQQIEFEDTGVATLEMKNGMIGGINWSVNTYMKNMEISLTLIAERGTIRLSGKYLNDISYQLVEEIEERDKCVHDDQTLQGSMSNHDKVYDNLLKAMKEDHIFPDASEDLKTVALIEHFYSQTKLL